ncbi:zinc finger, CCHC-type containing protein [Tanacetum coccineum]
MAAAMTVTMATHKVVNDARYQILIACFTCALVVLTLLSVEFAHEAKMSDTEDERPVIEVVEQSTNFAMGSDHKQLSHKSKIELMLVLRREILEKGMEGRKLNLPSFCLRLKPGERKFFKRTGQIVGNAKSKYLVKVNCERKGVKVVAVPDKFQILVGEVSKVSGSVKVEGTKVYVAQSPWIQSGKIEDNILFCKEMDRERYDMVLEACSLKKDLEILSFGEQTVIGLGSFSKDELMLMLRREIPEKGIEGTELNLPLSCLQLKPAKGNITKGPGKMLGTLITNVTSLINLRVAFHEINARRLPLAPLVYTLMTTSSANNVVFRGLFDKQKLIGPNIIDWYRQLRIVLSIEDKLNYLEQPLPPAPVAPAGQQVAPEILVAHTAWVKGSIEIAELMLMTMDLEIQQNLENLHAYDMIQELKTLLRKEFDRFVQNYNMHSLGKTVNELHAMLKLYEQTLTLPKNNAPILHAIRVGKVQKAELLKKKKNAAYGAGGSCIFIIELNTFLNRSWIYDTGCGTHICNTTQGLRASRKLKPGALSLYVGNGQREAVEAIGNFDLSLPSGLVIVLNNCHYAPSITRGVISVSRLYEDGFINRFVNNTIQVSRNNMVYFSAIPRDGIFEIDLSNSYTNENSIYTVSNKRAKLDLDSALLWHCRLGHISKKRIKKLPNDGLLNSTDLRAFEKCVPLFQKEVENQLGKTIKLIRSDRGGEYLSQEFMDHLKDHGIIAHRTPPYTPQHNGVSERRNRTLLDMVQSMMSQTTLPKSFWDYALETAARILNMVPTKKVEKTSYEIWHGQALKLSYLKV